MVAHEGGRGKSSHSYTRKESKDLNSIGEKRKSL